MVFMKKRIHFLCREKAASVLEVLLLPTKDIIGADFVMHVNAESEDGTALMDAILVDVRAESTSMVVGFIARETSKGKFLQIWDKKLKSCKLELTDVMDGFSDLFAVKDDIELMHVKKAALLTSSTMEHVVFPMLKENIVHRSEVSHTSLMHNTEKGIHEWSRALKLEVEKVGLFYPPIFQSGGEFDLKPNASNNDDDLYHSSRGVIICAIGTSYRSYCSNIARSFFVDANTIQQRAYNVLLNAHQAAIAALISGNKFSDVYQAAYGVVERGVPDFVAKLTKSAGTGIGLKFSEHGLCLNASNGQVLKVGMVFNMSLGFENISSCSKHPKSRTFSLLVADTVIVNDCHPEVVTGKSLKDFNEVNRRVDFKTVKMSPPVVVDVGSSQNARMNRVATPADLPKLRCTKMRRVETESCGVAYFP